MLKQLHIQNYSLIESLDIDFESGFSVITGETGAGKSIIIGALSLLLGGRADTSVISSGEKRCVVEAVFLDESQAIAELFERNDLDYEDGECIIRRELNINGKSRTFINDTPIALTTLKELSSYLIDIHSQHQNLLLANADFQLNVLDSVAQDEQTLSTYQQQYSSLLQAEQTLRKLTQDYNNKQGNEDFLRFQYEEISSAKLVEGEQESLEEELLLLENAENITQALYESKSNLANYTDKLTNAQRSLRHIADVLPSATPLSQRLESCTIEIDDIESELVSMLSNIHYDEQRLEEVTERLNTIYALQKKYHKQTTADLMSMQMQLKQSLDNIENSDEFIKQQESLCDKLRNECLTTANALSSARKASAQKVEQELVERLRPLGMPNISFKVAITPLQQLSCKGQDDVSFLFSANKSIPLCQLSKIASGGEIARVMLALKAMLSTHTQLPTIIFDEIDTGVSGRIADEMGNAMHKISNTDRQVICITHNPQIAARGQIHYRVFKKDSNNITHTYIEPLGQEQRIEELAKMLSGSAVTSAATANAKTLLGL